MERQIGSLYQPDPNSPTVAVVSPMRCRNGHRLGPNRALVSYARCSCDKARAGGHYSWMCRACGDPQIGDGHTEDEKLLSTLPSWSPMLAPHDGHAEG